MLAGASMGHIGPHFELVRPEFVYLCESGARKSFLRCQEITTTNPKTTEV